VARASWAFWLVHTPLNTQVQGGNGLIAQLTLATDRALTFTLTDADTLTFSMPLRDPRTDQVKVMATDVLAICNDRVVQRFRVKSRTRSKSGDRFSASFTAVSYRAVVAAWEVHDQDSSYTGTLPRNRMDWPESLNPAQRTPAQIMWTIASDGQATSGAHYIGLSAGHMPTGVAAVTLDGSAGGTVAGSHYLQAGESRAAAIDRVAALEPGFEWSIDPDPAAPLTALRFNVWTAGTRTQFTGSGVDSRSAMVLEAGSTIADWSESVDPASWANVLRVSGTDVTSTSTEGASATAWRPAAQVPSKVDYGDGLGARWPVEGAVERDVTSSRTTPQAIALTADREAALALDFLPDYSVTLAGGRWTGTDALWLGDQALVIIPDINLAAQLRVVNVGISLDSNGTESMTLGFTRTPVTDYGRFRRDLERRLTSLERGR
jgi:hypothetical protein